MDKVGSGARKTLTQQEMIGVRVKKRNQKAQAIEERKDAKEQVEQAEDHFMKEYVPIQKKKGVTNNRRAEEVLNRRFPRQGGEMTNEETLEYETFKSERTPEVRKTLEETDTLLLQLCALQYIPRDHTPIHPHFPYGKVAHVNAKIRGKKKNRHTETR